MSQQNNHQKNHPKSKISSELPPWSRFGTAAGCPWSARRSSTAAAPAAPAAPSGTGGTAAGTTWPPHGRARSEDGGWTRRDQKLMGRRKVD